MIGRQLKKDGVVYTINGVQKFRDLVEVTVYQNMEPICHGLIPDYAAKQVIESIKDYINKTDDVTIAGIATVFQDIERLCFGGGSVA